MSSAKSEEGGRGSTSEGVTKQRQAVRRVPIAEFVDEVWKHYDPKATSRTVCTRVRYVAAFLLRNTSVKTTADLTLDLVHEFAGSCGDLGHFVRTESLQQFRRICNLAVEWRCLKRSPFEDYRFSSARPESKRRGLDLDEGQVRRLLDYLESRKDTWQGHRLYTLAAVMIYTGIMTVEAIRLSQEDCDLERRVIRIKRQSKFRPPERPPVPIPPKLKAVLAEWLPRRGMVKPNHYSHCRYGMRMSDDGKTRVPDDAEQRILAEMRLWRSQGWSFERITRALNERKVPTKNNGASWYSAQVREILLRDVAAPPGPEAIPHWVFPGIRGKSHWVKDSPNGAGAGPQIREAGIAVGIEGLTLESLALFHRARKRTTFDFGQETRPEPSAPGLTPPEPAPWCSVVLGGPDDQPIVRGVTKPELKPAQYMVVKALFDAGSGGLAGPEFRKKSRCGGWRGVLKRLSKDADWGRAIHFPEGKSGGNYRLR